MSLYNFKINNQNNTVFSNSLQIAMVPAGSPPGGLRKVTIDVSEFNENEDLDYGFIPPADNMIYPSVKANIVEGRTQSFTLTFGQPLLLKAGQEYKINIGHIKLNENAKRAKTVKINVLVTTFLDKVNKQQAWTSGSFSFSGAVSVLNELKVVTPIAVWYDKLHLSWLYDEVTHVNIATANKTVSYQITNSKRQLELKMRDVIRDLQIKPDKKSIDAGIYLNDDAQNLKKVKIGQYNMWYKYEIIPDDQIFHLITTECDDKIWGISAGKTENDLQLWYCSDGLEWTNAGVEIDWSPLKNALLAAIKQQKQTTKPIYHLPPAVIVKVANGYELSFVGGSKVECKLSLVTVFSCIFQIGKGAKAKLGNTNPALPEAISLHGLTLFEYQQGERIWLIGGANSKGMVTNKVRALVGDSWKDVDKGKFPARCQFSIARYAKNELWISGGNRATEHNPVKETWRFVNTGSGTRCEPVPVKDKNALVPPVYDVKNPADINTIRINTSALTAFSAMVKMELKQFLHYLAIVDYNKGYSGKVEVFTEGKFNLSPSHPTLYEGGGGWSGQISYKLDGQTLELEQLSYYWLQTVSFKGCIWLMPLRYNDDMLIPSPLYYFMPEV